MPERVPIFGPYSENRKSGTVIRTAKNAGRVPIGIAAAKFVFFAENLDFRPTRTVGTTRRHLREDRWIPDSIRLFALPCAVE